MIKFMTKRENYTAIRAIVADNAELVAFIDHELELLDKKNSKRSDKPTAKQSANAELAEQIYGALANAKEPMTCTAIADMFGISNQKCSALIKGLIDNNRVVRSYEKRVARFSVA